MIKNKQFFVRLPEDDPIFEMLPGQRSKKVRELIEKGRLYENLNDKNLAKGNSNEQCNVIIEKLNEISLKINKLENRIFITEEIENKKHNDTNKFEKKNRAKFLLESMS